MNLLELILSGIGMSKEERMEFWGELVDQEIIRDLEACFDADGRLLAENFSDTVDLIQTQVLAAKQKS